MTAPPQLPDPASAHSRWPRSASMCAADPVFIPAPSKGVGFKSAFWTGEHISTLRVSFLGADDLLCAKVFAIGRIWGDHAKIKFERSEAANAEIRIAFSSGLTSHTRIGTNALTVVAGTATMTLAVSLATDPQELNRIVLHEFGHALGLGHEHQSPNVQSGIKWKLQSPGVYEYFWDNLRWDRAAVDQQILAAYSRSYCITTDKFDPRSIMMYRIPSEIVTDGHGVSWNDRLSPMDIEFIGKVYR